MPEIGWMDWLQLPAMAAVFLALRLAPLRAARERGCDAYYFLQCAAAFRRDRHLPITLPPVYLLEPAEQWYPPGFSVFLGLLPPRFVERWHWALGSLLDMIVALAIAAWLLTTTGPVWAWAGLIAYGTAAFMAMEYGTMSSRPLAALLLFSFLLSSWLWTDAGVAWLAVAVGFGVLLLYTHKLSVQLLWFVVPFLAVAEETWRWLLPLPLAYAVALAVDRSLFVKIQVAHWDIVRFWHRHWPALGAHIVDDSPLFGGNGQSRSYYRSTGVRGTLLHLRRVLQYNPWLVTALLVVGHWPALGPFERLLAWCVLAVHAWACLTLWVPFLRCLGEGTKYVKFALPASLVLTFGAVLPRAEAWEQATIAVVALAHAALYAFAFKALYRPGTPVGTLDDDLLELIAALNDEPAARVVCLPTHICDLVAHRSGKPVLWGSHGYGFQWLRDFFPVLRRPLAELARRHALTHLVLDTRYAALDHVAPPPGETRRYGPYVLHRFAIVPEADPVRPTPLTRPRSAA